MRNTFSEALYDEATKNPDIYIVVSDISPAGSMVKFTTQYPERFINVGVAEQSMIGICAGLALKGCQPFAYTIATFSLYRPFEMVRDDLGYQNLPVKVVGTLLEDAERAEILQALVRVHELRAQEHGCLRAIAGIHSVFDINRLAALWPADQRASIKRGGIALALRVSEPSFLEKFHAGVTR